MLTRIFLAVFFLCCVTGFVKQYNYLRTPEQLRNNIIANLRYDTCGTGTMMQYINSDKSLYTYYFASDSVVESNGTQIAARNEENRTAAVSGSVLAGTAGGTTGGYSLNKVWNKNTPGSGLTTQFVAGVCEILSGYFLGEQVANFTRPGAKSKILCAILADKKNWPDLHRQYVRGLISYTYVIAKDIKDPARQETLTQGLSDVIGDGKVLLGYLDYSIVRDRLHAIALAAGQSEEKTFNKAKTIENTHATFGTVASLALLAFVIYRQRKGQKANNELKELPVGAEPGLR